MFLLDTNVLSELRKAGDGKADRNVIAWFSNEDAVNFYVSAITLMEIEIGIQRMERRDADQGARLRAWMRDRVLPEFSNRTLPLDAAVSLRCAVACAGSASGTGCLHRGYRAGARDDARYAKRVRFFRLRGPPREPLGSERLKDNAQAAPALSRRRMSRADRRRRFAVNPPAPLRA